MNVVSERYTGGELINKIVGSTIRLQMRAGGKSRRDHRIAPLFDLDEEGSPIRLIDFSLSRRHGLDDVDMTNKVDTPYCMSPGFLEVKYDRLCNFWAWVS